ncbi:MAG: hypothetical protein P1U32_04545 [Legionellaceae bacterium]|nr:hypothetical protein [Legionellaceae bacterium]
MLSLAKRFFSSIAPEARIYHAVGESSLLPKKLEGIVKFDPGIAKQVSPKELNEILKGYYRPPMEWPVSVWFRTNALPHVPDGLSGEACIWRDKKIEAEILAYTTDYGVEVYEVTPLEEDGNNHTSEPESP